MKQLSSLSLSALEKKLRDQNLKILVRHFLSQIKVGEKW